MTCTGLTYALLCEFLGTLRPPVQAMMFNNLGYLSAARLRTDPRDPSRSNINPAHSGIVELEFKPGHGFDQEVLVQHLNEAQRAFGFTREDVFEFLLEKWEK